MRSFLYIRNVLPGNVALGRQTTFSMDILLFSPFPWGSIAEKDIICYEISFWSMWASVSACLLTTSCLSSVFLPWKQSGEKALMLCYSITAKIRCVISAVLNTHGKHSTIWAAMKEVNSIQDKPGTKVENISFY